MMRRAIVCCVLALLLPVVGSTGASAAPVANGTTTFAVVAGVGPTAAGYAAHISGVGLDGPWAGWHFAADMLQSSDCDAGGCPILRFAWELYDKTAATSKEWGTCTGSPYCEGATSISGSGLTDIPLVVNGGAPWTQGTGRVSGYLPPGSYLGDGAGYLALTLQLQ